MKVIRLHGQIVDIVDISITPEEYFKQVYGENAKPKVVNYHKELYQHGVVLMIEANNEVEKGKENSCNVSCNDLSAVVYRDFFRVLSYIYGDILFIGYKDGQYVDIPEIDELMEYLSRETRRSILGLGI